MPTFSSRLGFELPAELDSMADGDLVLAKNYIRIDDTIGITSVTSLTRPASPFQGQTIYETDTTRYMLYDGTTWVRFAPQGVGSTKAVATTSALSTHTTTETAITGMTVTFAAVTGITYGIIWSMDVIHSAGNVENTAFLRWASGGSVTTADALLFSYAFKNFNFGTVAGATIGRSFPGAFGWVSPVTGTVTLGLSLSTASGTATLGAAHVGAPCDRTFLVEAFI